MSPGRRVPVRRLLALAVLAGAPSCVTPPNDLYDWGDIEDCIYETCTNPDGFDRQEQILILVEQIEETEAEGKRVPPGLRAHLGYLYSEEGNVDRTVVLFHKEMEHFPESAVFYRGLLRRLGVPEEATEAEPAPEGTR